MSRLFTILALVSVIPFGFSLGQEELPEIEKIRQDRERLIDLIIEVQESYRGTLKDFARLQDDYAALAKKNMNVPDHSAEVAELRNKLKEALDQLKNQPPAGKPASSHALLEQDLVNLRNELHRQRQELLVARAQVLRVKKLEEQNKTLEEKLKLATASEATAKAKIKTMQAERDDLMGKLKGSMAKFEESNKARTALLARLEQLEKENKTLKEKVLAQEAQIADLAKIEEDYKKAQTAATDLRKENLRLTKLLGESEKKLANLQQHLAAEVKRTLEIPVLIQAKEDLEKKLKAGEAKTKELAAEKDILTARKTELEAEIATVKKNINEIRTQLDKNQAAMTSVGKLTKENDTLKARQTELEKALETVKTELAKSTETRKALETRLTETVKLADANAELKQMNVALKEEQELLHNQLVNTKSNLEDSQKLAGELEASLLELTKEKADLTNAIKGNETEIKKLEAEVARQPAMIEKLEKLEQEKGNLSTQLEKREDDLKKTRSELGRLQINAKVAQKQLADLKRKESKIDPVLYALGEAEIQQQQTRVLEQVQEVLKHFPEARFEIVGHTCDIGKPADNLELSRKRARSLHDFLVSNGVPPDRIKSRGVGQSEPKVPNDSEANRRLNRRVVVEILD